MRAPSTGRFAASLLVLAAAFSAAPVLGQPRPISGILVFTERGFRGRSAVFRDDVDNLRDTGFNDRIWSLRVAPGETWEVCVDRDYRGRCTLVSGDEPDLSRSGWNNLISSMRRVRNPEPQRPERRRGWSIVIYERPDYRGRPARFDEESPILQNFSGRAGSLTIERGVWDVCEGPNFSGRCAKLDRSVPDLAAIGMRDQVGSVRPAGSIREEPPPPEPPPPYDRGWTIIVFDGRDYRGSPVTFDRAVPDLGTLTRRAESVTIPRGIWELCEGPNFTGRCVTLDQSVPDLAAYGLRRRVGSIRPGRPQPR